MLPTFVTGNLNKVAYLRDTLAIKLEHHAIDLTEIQSVDPREVVERKAHEAFSLLKKPVLIEDTSLTFNVLVSLPGPLVKHFVHMDEADRLESLEKMCRMLDGFDDRSAFGSAVYGYYDGQRIEYFTGHLDGMISQHPRGTGGYGWDAIFEPVGYNGLTRAELSPEQDIETYAKLRDVVSLKQFLKNLSDATIQ
jgi:non-canonical purine NTP pyrophosphatase (RdgB/HAM1 family)